MTVDGILDAIFADLALAMVIPYVLSDFNLFPSLRARVGFTYPPPSPPLPPPPLQLNDIQELAEQQLAELRQLTACTRLQTTCLRRQLDNQEIIIAQLFAALQIAIIAMGQPADPAFDILDLDHLDLD
jgi:hypothetical protein